MRPAVLPPPSSIVTTNLLSVTLAQPWDHPVKAHLKRGAVDPREVFFAAVQKKILELLQCSMYLMSRRKDNKAPKPLT